MQTHRQVIVLLSFLTFPLISFSLLVMSSQDITRLPSVSGRSPSLARGGFAGRSPAGDSEEDEFFSVDGGGGGGVGELEEGLDDVGLWANDAEVEAETGGGDEGITFAGMEPGDTVKDAEEHLVGRGGNLDRTAYFLPPFSGEADVDFAALVLRLQQAPPMRSRRTLLLVVGQLGGGGGGGRVCSGPDGGFKVTCTIAKQFPEPPFKEDFWQRASGSYAGGRHQQQEGGEHSAPAAGAGQEQGPDREQESPYQGADSGRSIAFPSAGPGQAPSPQEDGLPPRWTPHFEVSCPRLPVMVSATQWEPLLDVLDAFRDYASGHAAATWEQQQGLGGGSEQLLHVAAEAAQAAVQAATASSAPPRPLTSLTAPGGLPPPGAASASGEVHGVSQGGGSFSLAMTLGCSVTIFAGPERSYGSSISAAAALQRPSPAEGWPGEPTRWEVLPCLRTQAALQAQASVRLGQLSSLCLDMHAATVGVGSLALCLWEEPTRQDSGGSADPSPQRESSKGVSSDHFRASWQAIPETVPLAHLQDLQLSFVQAGHCALSNPEPPLASGNSSLFASRLKPGDSSSQAACPPSPSIALTRNKPEPAGTPEAQTCPRTAAAATAPSPAWASLRVHNVSLYAGSNSLAAAARFAVAAVPGSDRCAAPDPGGGQRMMGSSGAASRALALPALQAALSVKQLAMLLFLDQQSEEGLRQRKQPLFEAALLDLSVGLGVKPVLSLLPGGAKGLAGCNEVSASASGSLLLDVFNSEKRGWEPALEPWALQVSHILNFLQSHTYLNFTLFHTMD